MFQNKRAFVMLNKGLIRSSHWENISQIGSKTQIETLLVKFLVPRIR